MVPPEFEYLYQPGPKRPVVKIPNPVLRQAAAPVKKIDSKVDQLIDRLMKIMKMANGVGLAAPQIGTLQQIFVMAPEGVKPVVLINPIIIKTEGSFTGQEGCLSIPGLYGDVSRSDGVLIHALDRKGRELEYELDGMPAKIAQHEIDHLEGRLFIDLVNKETLHWSHPDGEPAAD